MSKESFCPTPFDLGIKAFDCIGKSAEIIDKSFGNGGFAIKKHGKFEIAQKDLRLKFRGSRNQRIIDVQRSLNEQGVILYDE